MLNEYLKNSTVTKIEHVHDYIQLYFEPDGILNIYNPYEVVERSGRTIIDKLIGLKVTSVEANPQRNLVLFFEANKILTIDMRMESFSGPEGMELIFHNRPIIVWQEGE